MGNHRGVPAGWPSRLHAVGARSRAGQPDRRGPRQRTVPAGIPAAAGAARHGRPGEGRARRRPARGRRAHPRPWIPVVSLSKGLERESLLRMTQLIREVLPGHPAAALTGPNLAKEIMAGQAAASVIATEDLAVARALQSVLQRGTFRVYTNHDVIGCELGGALKNVVAIATGVAQGLGV